MQVGNRATHDPPGRSQRGAASSAAFAAVILLLLAGCAGEVPEVEPAHSAPIAQPAPSAPPAQPPQAPRGLQALQAAAAAQAAQQVVDRPKVTLPPAPVKLLPLEVRLRRAAAALGVPAEDRVFDAVREQRLALGAHDFVNGTAPDLQWNSQRMATWIAAMLPVCRDARVRSYLGDWKQGGLAKFVQGAFGRPSTADDLADLSAALAVTGDDGWVATCLSLVSSAEMVLQ